MIGFFAEQPRAPSTRTSATKTARPARRRMAARILEPSAAVNSKRARVGGSEKPVLAVRSPPQIHQRDEVVDAVRGRGRGEASRQHEEQPETGADGCRP